MYYMQNRTVLCVCLRCINKATQWLSISSVKRLLSESPNTNMLYIATILQKICYLKSYLDVYFQVEIVTFTA